MGKRMTAAGFRTRRELSGLTGRHLATLLGTDDRAVRRWESGKRPVPDSIAQQMRRISAETRTAVADMVAAADGGPLLTYPDDEQYTIVNPSSPWSASWHRAVTARAAEETGLPVDYAPRLTEIASHIPGRSVHDYDLLDDVMEVTGLGASEAHASIHAMLDDVIAIEGEDEVIRSKRPIRPELLTYNPGMVDVYWWLAVRQETADEIRDALAATYAE